MAQTFYLDSFLAEVVFHCKQHRQIKSLFSLSWTISKASPSRAWFWAGRGVVHWPHLLGKAGGPSEVSSYCSPSAPFSLHLEADGKIQGKVFLGWFLCCSQPNAAARNMWFLWGKGGPSIEDKRMISILVMKSHTKQGIVYKAALKTRKCFLYCQTCQVGSRHLNKRHLTWFSEYMAWTRDWLVECDIYRNFFCCHMYFQSLY